MERTCGDLKKKVDTLEYTISKLERTQGKMDELMKLQVKCVYPEDELLKKLLNEDIDAALPKVYMNPQGITYKVRNGVGYFRVP